MRLLTIIIIGNICQTKPPAYHVGGFLCILERQYFPLLVRFFYITQNAKSFMATAPAVDLPIIFIPGLGADRRIFGPQLQMFPNAIVAERLPAMPDESLDDYAQRLAEKYDPKGPCYIVGHSFGGVLAPKVARHLDVRGVILVSSIRGATELPTHYRICRPIVFRVRWLAKLFMLGFIGMLRCMLTVCPWLMTKARRNGARQFIEIPLDNFYWIACRTLDWNEAPPEHYDFPLFQIHGAWDPVLHCRRTSPDVAIPRAGHLITLSHADEVNAFIREKIEAIEAGDLAGSQEQ